jgi:single-stranded-DNA-specific exonuclease
VAIPYLWERLACNDEAAAVLADALKISPAVARLLAIRGLDEPETAYRFLHPSLDHLHDPFKLADMAPAVDRILAALGECTIAELASDPPPVPGRAAVLHTHL